MCNVNSSVSRTREHGGFHMSKRSKKVVSKDETSATSLSEEQHNIINELSRWELQGNGKSRIVEQLNRLSIASGNAITETFQSAQLRDAFVQLYDVEQDAPLYQFPIEMDRQVASIETWIKDVLRDELVFCLIAGNMSQGVQREMLQSLILLQNWEQFTKFVKFLESRHIVVKFQVARRHKIHGWTKGTVTLDSSTLETLKAKLVGTIEMFRIVFGDLSLRSRSKQIQRDVKIPKGGTIFEDFEIDWDGYDES